MSDPAADPAISTEQQQKFLQTGQLFEALAADPKYRRKVLGIIKEVNPNAVIPELEVDAAVERGVAERVKPVEETNTALRKEVDELKRMINRDKFAETTGLSEDELVEVEALAKDAGITKGETAVEHWRMKNQLGTPRPTPQTKAGEEYVAKLRKVKPTDTVRLKQLAIEEGTRIIRETRGRRAG